MISPYTGKAQDYARYRLPYAPEVIDVLCRYAEVDDSWAVADIGCGAGNLAQHLASRVSLIYGVEPDVGMLQEAVRQLGAGSNFTAVNATAEATTLPDNSVDLITVGQAVHWFDMAKAHAEFDRILKPAGCIGFIWNRLPNQEQVDLSSFWAADREPLYQSFSMRKAEDWEHFIGGVRTAAAAPRPGEPEYAAFEERNRVYFDMHARDGLITVEYQTELAVGQMQR